MLLRLPKMKWQRWAGDLSTYSILHVWPWLPMMITHISILCPTVRVGNWNAQAEPIRSMEEILAEARDAWNFWWKRDGHLSLVPGRTAKVRGGEKTRSRNWRSLAKGPHWNCGVHDLQVFWCWCWGAGSSGHWCWWWKAASEAASRL